MRNSVVYVALSALGLAAATNFTIDPNSVSLTTRSNWCTAQDNTCSTLCDGNPKTDTCDPNTLSYSCLCQNSSAPGLEYYTQTMPTFICNEAYSECIVEYANNATGQSACTTDIKDHCGTLNSEDYTAAVSSSSSVAAATATAAATTSGSASAATTTSSANAAPTAMAHYGNGAAAVAVGIFAYIL